MKNNHVHLKPVDLSYEVFGDGYPMVLIHGYPLNRSIWYPIVPLLQNHAKLILPDLRGYGTSPAVEGVSTMRLMAEDVYRLLEYLNIEKAILVGHSMGGYVSFAFAQAYPGHLAGLGLVSTQAEADSPERRQARLITARDVKSKGAKLIAESMPQKLTENADIQEKVKQMILSAPTETIINTLKGLAERPDATEWLSAIKVPAVVIAGTEDKIIPHEKADLMCQMLGRGWLVNAKGAGHMPMMETPEIVAEGLHQLMHTVTG